VKEKANCDQSLLRYLVCGTKVTWTGPAGRKSPLPQEERGRETEDSLVNCQMREREREERESLSKRMVYSDNSCLSISCGERE
jgi:hypothetical protein